MVRHGRALRDTHNAYAAQASTGDVGIIIETFPVRQFPKAAGHYGGINDTPRDGDEMIVDMHTIVNERSAMQFTVVISCC